MNLMKPRRIAIVGLTSAAMVLGAAAPALAVVDYVGGGTWNYGVNNNGGEVWSNYHHPNNNHRSSVINGYGEYRSSGCVGKGVWSYASLRAHPDDTDYAYWSNSC